MNVSVFPLRAGALWSHGAPRPSEYRSMAAAIAIGVVIELVMVFGASHMHFSESAPQVPRAAMHAALVKIDVPPPPPSTPQPEIKKIVKRQAAIPQPAPPQSAPTTPSPPVIAAAEHPAPSAPAVATTSDNVIPQAATTPAAASIKPVAIGLICPVQASPEMPKKAIAEGIVGSVLARAKIRAGKVIQVDIVRSQPSGVFDEAVRLAMSHYQCDSNSTDTVVAEQNFNFTLSD
jgi:protein TonB